MKALFDLQQGQYITIKGQKYEIVAKMKFIEGSSYWIEYKIIQVDNREENYLNVEISGKITLSKIIKESLKKELNIQYNGDTYKLIGTGHAKIETYMGYIDVGLKEEVQYYEYENERKDIITIEEWKDMTEISTGIYVEQKEIKIEKGNKYD